jgi:cAMP-specific phosphodiesterase 4
LVTDKQEDLDLPFLRFEDGIGQQSQPGHVVATGKNALPGPVFGPANRQESIQSPQKPGQTMSQISGVKKPLSHTNSLTKLPKYGVETPHEEELGKMLEEIDKWGLDVFQVAEYSNKHPLTTIMYTIFRVSFYNFFLISNIYYIQYLCLPFRKQSLCLSF